MRLRFIVDVEVNFTSGKFAAKSDIADEIRSEIDNCNPGSLSVGEGEYEVQDWDVGEDEPPKIKRARKPQPAKELPCKRCRNLTRFRVRRQAICPQCQTPEEIAGERAESPITVRTPVLVVDNRSATMEITVTGTGRTS